MYTKRLKKIVETHRKYIEPNYAITTNVQIVKKYLTKVNVTIETFTTQVEIKTPRQGE